MNKRIFGKTAQAVSEIGLGTWQLGAVWGQDFDAQEAERILDAAYENGITLIDTADVYNGGESEKAIGRILKKYPKHFYVVSKVGRRSNPHVAEAYTPEAIEAYIDDSLARLDIDKLDMVLLHCPPSSVYSNDEVFHALDRIQEKGKIANYGVSIEKVEEGLKAMNYNIAAIEVIFNMFRQKPAEVLLPEAAKRDIAILARVPLASGILTGKFSKDTKFGDGDHRTYNRNGEAFDKGETFSGVDYDLGIEAAEELKQLFGTENLIPYALRWILMNDAVSVVIPGASKAEHVASNVKAAKLPELTAEQIAGVKDIYDRLIKPSVHHLW